MDERTPQGQRPHRDVDMILTLHRAHCRPWQESRQRCETCIRLEARGRMQGTIRPGKEEDDGWLHAIRHTMAKRV